MAPQVDGGDTDRSTSTQVLPESAFLDILSAIRFIPDFSQRLSTLNEYGQSLLHLAVHLRYRQLAEQLVEWGVRLDVQDINGFTPLHFACLCEDDLMVTILKRSGASMTISDALGRFPIDLSENPIVSHPNTEMAGTVGPDTRYRSQAPSECSSGGSINEHQSDSAGPAGYPIVDEAFPPPMSPCSSDQNGMCDHLYNGPSRSIPANGSMVIPAFGSSSRGIDR